MGNFSMLPLVHYRPANCIWAFRHELVATTMLGAVWYCDGSCMVHTFLRVINISYLEMLAVFA